MRNIRKPVYRYLFNSLNTFDNRDNHSIGLYNDHKLKRKVLCLNGFQLLGSELAAANDTSTDDPVTLGTSTTKIEFSKASTDDGVYKGVLLRLDNTAPASSIDWPYALSIVEKVKLGNVHTNRNNQQQKTYSGVLRRIETTGITINSEYIRKAEDDIITQIANDAGLHINNTDPISKMSGAVCDAYRIFKITVAAGTDHALITTYTNVKGDGTAYDVTLGATSMLGAAAINGTATLKTLVKAWCASTTTIYIASRVNGQLFDVEDGGGATAITVDYMGIMLAAKNVNVQFDATYDINTWTSESFNMMELTDATSTGTFYIKTVNAGTVTTTSSITESGTLATMAANINSGTMGTGAYASYDDYGNRTIIWGNANIDNIIFVANSAPTTEVYKQIAYDARYPSLTSDDIFRIFWNQRDGGSLSAMGYMDQPEANTDYNKYRLVSKEIPVSDVHGASFNTTTEVELELYVKKSICTTSYWDLVNGDPQCYMKAATSADTGLEALLQIFVGTAVASW